MTSSEAQLLVIGPDESESSFSFDALVDESDGDYMSSKMQYVNNDILVECVLMQGFKELRVSCGDMQWVLPGGKQHISPGKTYACEAEDGTTATAHIEVEDFDGDNAGDVAISTLILDTSPPAAFMEGDSGEQGDEDGAPAKLGMITYKV